MIDGLRLSKYLHDTGLKIQEFWLLYAILSLERVFDPPSIPILDDSVDFNKYMKSYFDTHLPDVASTVKWSDVAFKLEENGWVDIQQTKEGPLQLDKCKTTEQFKQYLLVSDVMKAFREWLAIYPNWVYIEGNGPVKKFTTIDMSLEVLADMYNDKVLKNNNLPLHERCMHITELYVKDNGGKALYKISQFFERYEGIAIGIESEINDRHKQSTSGKRTR